MRIGIDVGGTFTDMVLIDDATGVIHDTKTLSTPHHLAQGVMMGLEKVLRLGGTTMRDVAYVVHGTTIGTNALIERTGVKTGLLTTEGFRDILEIGRVQRPAAGLYDVTIDNPAPLVPRYLRQEVRERVGSDGRVLVPLDERSVVRAITQLKAEKVEAIAVSLLFAFLNPTHERRMAALCRRLVPDVTVSLSSDIAPEFREYERTSTTVLDAYLKPIVRRYIESLEEELQRTYGRVDLRIMQASGGSMTAAAARSHAVNVINSGPAGGAVAGSFVGKLTGETKLITVDMGGTSFDIGVIDEGVPRLSSEAKFEGFPVKIPVIAIDAIGAGGGSLAWIDKGGALNVGPQSAGADPGPACYGRGGDRPTVTDANLVLGRINADFFLGGEMHLDRSAAERAIETSVAKPMKLPLAEAAEGIVRLVNANMVKGISVNSIEKGYDVREFALIAFGGAGPLHAVDLARDLGMRKVIVPSYAGNLSALGLLVSDTRHDFVQTLMKTQREVKPEALTAAFRRLEERGHKQLAAERVRAQDMLLVWSADLRYEGQSYELNTPVARKAAVTAADIAAIVTSFHALHRKAYAYASTEEVVEFVNLRVTAIGRSPEVRLQRHAPRSPDPRSAQKGTRLVYFAPEGFREVPMYHRPTLQAGARVPGPAIIEEQVSSTVVPPDTEALIDPYLNIVITLRG